MGVARHAGTGAGAPYRGCRVAMGTRHRKDRQVAPAFAALLGAQVVVPPDLDTDRFGTFTAERPRRMRAIEAARAKALLGMRTAGTRYGLASEATYGLLAGTGCPVHEEILLFTDHSRGIEIVETARRPSLPACSFRVRSIDDMSPSLVDCRPAQGWIVRPAGTDDLTALSKGVRGRVALSRAVAEALRHSPENLAIVEPDLRALHNPLRRRVIEGLAYRLATRLRTRCPRCATPGFGRLGVEPGLPCRICGTQTELPRAELHGCAACPHRNHKRAASEADPRWCPFCNP